MLKLTNLIPRYQPRGVQVVSCCTRSAVITQALYNGLAKLLAAEAAA